MRAVWAVPAAAVALGLGLVAGCGGAEDEAATPTTAPVAEVRFGQVQQFFDRHCVACHPSVNPSLDLRPGRSYRDIVGVPAVEAPGLVRVVAGDPEASFLYQKVQGVPGLGDIPGIGTRMPPMAPRLPESEIRILRDWIAAGAKNAEGRTVSAGAVPVAGARDPIEGLEEATEERGTGTVTGRVLDERGRPLGGAIVTLLLKGPDQPDGEEHVRAALTRADGRYTMPEVPEGRIELKAYGPRKIYVSRVVEVDEGESVDVAFGLPDRAIANPEISSPRVERTATGVRLSARLDGFSLDRNYTIAVNPDAGRTFELRALTTPEGETRAGVWSREVEGGFTGDWIFLAVDETCNGSEFLVVSSPS
jgi:mono/diheme cytochrome c family protein